MDTQRPLSIVVISDCDPVEVPLLAGICREFPGASVIRPTFSAPLPEELRRAAPKPLGLAGRLRSRAAAFADRVRSKLWREWYGWNARREGLSVPNPLPFGTVDLPWFEINRERGRQAVAARSPDVILALRAPILKPEIFGQARICALNFHNGIPSKYRGNHCIFWALMARDYEGVGSAVHWIDAGIDTGAILLEAYPALDGRTGECAAMARAIQQMGRPIVELLREIERTGTCPKGRAPTSRGPLYRSKDRTLGAEARYLLRRLIGRVRPPRREGRVERYLDNA